MMMQEQDPIYHASRPSRREGPKARASWSDLNRRRFLQLFGGGIAVVCVSGGAAVLTPPEELVLDTDSIGAWLHIREDGSVIVFTGKVEVGQNIRTSLAQAVAEELRIAPNSIRMVMGDTDQTPYDRGTFGSRTTPDMSPQLRKAGAAARELLLDLAAEEWNVDRSRLMAEDGKISDPSNGRALTFGALTQGRELVEVIPPDVRVTPASEWNVAGTSVPKVRGRSFVTGAHEYVSDMAVSDMLVGKILRPPSFGAGLESLDASRAEAMPGVTVVRDGNFVGVAAPDAASAERARDSLRAEWSTTPQPSDGQIFTYLKEHPSDAAGWRGRSSSEEGDVDAGFEQADVTLEERYTVDYIAHVPLEPRAAVAEWTDGKVTVWTGTQRPFGVREELMEMYGISEDRVRVIMPDTGSAYGGKHTGDAALEAARLARIAGKPVKLVWTREEEFTWAYLRPAGIIEIRSGMDAAGRITTWNFDNYNSGGAGIGTPYEIPNQRISFHPSESPLRQGSYRALAATANNFGRESHMDELAHAAAMDPLEFRLLNLRDDRLRAVLEAAADTFGWNAAPQQANRGVGIACGAEKGGFVATCAEVHVDPDTQGVRVVRVTEAFECGAVINPNHLKSQIEGCIIQGLGGALFESIKFAAGSITNPRLSQYRVPRFSDTPELEVVLVDRKDLPSAGAGETPIIGIAPAVGNAIFDAVGVRLRALPLAPDGVRSS